MSDSIAVENRPLTLNGMGVRTKTFLNIKVYVVGLYLETAPPQQNLWANSAAGSGRSPKA
jgi:hypothetical protein